MKRARKKSNGGRPTKEQALLRDERVLRVATKAFIAHGFAATSLESIARLSRVALRTIYQQYGDKGGIFTAVIRRQLKHLSIFRFEADSDGSIQDSLNRIARELLGACTAPQSVALQRLMTAESLRFPQLMMAVSAEGYRRINHAIAAILGEAHKRHLLRIENKRLAAKLFVELTVGWSLMLCATGNRSAIPSNKELRERVDIFLKAYGTS
jgi:TetR/AcrR family transcriptional regulator, mexJK operon transcriptional repressor